MTEQEVKDIITPRRKSNIHGVNNYVKNPVKTQALKWTGVNVDEMREFLGVRFVIKHSRFTLEGNDVNVGDYAIKDTENKTCACRSDIFKANYKLSL